MKIGDIAFTNLPKVPAAKLDQLRVSPNVIRVSADAKATTIAQTLRGAGNGVVLVHFQNEPQKIQGILAPSWMRRRMVEHLKLDKKISLEEALETMIADPAEAARGFHHEWLNSMEAPDLIYCNKGEHWVDSLPCDQHG
jgi:hypothetical protein